jgi:hypothetical protein
MAIALKTATDQAVVTGLNNQSSASFTLLGGLYGFTVVVGAAGNIGLQIQAPDGSFIDCLTKLTANGYSGGVYLPPGTYQFAGTSTSANAAVTRIKLT